MVDAIYIPVINVCEHLIYRYIQLTYRFSNVYIIPSSVDTNDNIKLININDESYLIIREKYEKLKSNEICSNMNLYHGDLPIKRTIAIKHALSNGYKSILLLDDDIWPVHQNHIELFSKSRATVGGAYPDLCADISSTERAFNIFSPHKMLNGNYLFIKLNVNLPLFPLIYNEDWLFLHFLRRDCIIFDHPKIFQDIKNSNDIERAENEEFGELIIDILFDTSSLQEAKCPQRISRIYTGRRRQLEDELAKASGYRSLVIRSALNKLLSIDEHLIRAYVCALWHDMSSWSYSDGG